MVFKRLVLFLSVITWFSISGFAAAVAPCNANFTACYIFENVLLQLPFTGIAGDVIVQEPNSTAVSDVFRLFNNLFDTGGGTGLGNMVFLYSVDNSPLPDPSTYSANAQAIKEAVTGYTSFNGNGTIYILDVPEPSTFGLLGLGVIAMLFLSRKRVTGFAALTLLVCVAAFAQDDVPTVDPLDPSSGTYSHAIGLGPAQSNGTAQATGLAFFSANYASLGTSRLLPFNVVGSNPANGAATTTIPTVIVPIKVVYQTAGGLFLDGTNVVPAVQNSPIFLTADYTVGGTDLGVTQFGDALQRGQFWQLPGFSQAGYHVLLGTPTIAQTVTITIANSTQGNLYRLRSGGLLGVVRSSFFDGQLNALLPSYSANTLPIFLTDNAYEGSNGTINTCCILGYHNSQTPPAATAKTWIYAAYTEPGTFVGDVILDVQALSHEVAEWLNDPFVGAFTFGFLNVIPPAVLPGQGGSCIINFETGDPLEAPPAVFTQVTNGTTYHLQDEVFLPWYLHTTPSFSVNGWYTLQNTSKTFSSLCGPG
jgi:PEP-CTERM motif